jgi:hypothetical protein
MKHNKFYTGEGFRNEKMLALVAAAFTIVSSVFLIQLTLLQRKHIEMQMKEMNKEK